MAEVQFEPGDVVELVSGSLSMSVKWVEEEDGIKSAYCQWAEKTKNGQDMKGDKFVVAVLRHFEPKAKIVVPEMKSGFP